jgi:hypothetical protein
MISGKMSVKRLRNHKLASTGRADLAEGLRLAETACGPPSAAAAASRKIPANSRLH